MSISFTVPGDPIGKGRPRFVRATGHTYTPPKTKEYEERVRRAYPGAKYADDAMLRLEIDAFFPVPKSKRKSEKEKMAANIIRPVKKPDADNVIKAIMDALNGAAYHDDAQIVEVRCRKWYAQNDDPRVEIYIEEIKNHPTKE